jgi:hypothetical protein
VLTQVFQIHLVNADFSVHQSLSLYTFPPHPQDFTGNLQKNDSKLRVQFFKALTVMSEINHTAVTAVSSHFVLLVFRLLTFLAEGF